MTRPSAGRRRSSRRRSGRRSGRDRQTGLPDRSRCPARAVWATQTSASVSCGLTRKASGCDLLFEQDVTCGIHENRRPNRRMQAMPRGGKRSTSFKPGMSGNPDGRPKRSQTLERMKIEADVKALAQGMRGRGDIDPQVDHARCEIPASGAPRRGKRPS